MGLNYTKGNIKIWRQLKKNKKKACTHFHFHRQCEGQRENRPETLIQRQLKRPLTVCFVFVFLLPPATPSDKGAQHLATALPAPPGPPCTREQGEAPSTPCYHPGRSKCTFPVPRLLSKRNPIYSMITKIPGVKRSLHTRMPTTSYPAPYTQPVTPQDVTLPTYCLQAGLKSNSGSSAGT